MAKMKLGDITIDGEQISFTTGGEHGRSQSMQDSRGNAQLPAVVAADHSLAHTLAALPLRTRALVVTGAILEGSGATILLLGALWNRYWATLETFSLRYLFVAIPLCCLGSGLLGLALLKRFFRPEQQKPVVAPAEPSILAARVARLKTLLRGGSADSTVEHLVKASGMTERVLLETLHLMKQDRLIEEELNLDTGEWYYRLADSAGTTGMEPKYLSLDDRLAIQQRKEEIDK